MTAPYFMDAFERRPDGSWVCVAHVQLTGPHGRMEVARGTIFTPGTVFMGVDLAAWLDQQAGGRT